VKKEKKCDVLSGGGKERKKLARVAQTALANLDLLPRGKGKRGEGQGISFMCFVFEDAANITPRKRGE